jgi:hypothetical protein
MCYCKLHYVWVLAALLGVLDQFQRKKKDHSYLSVRDMSVCGESGESESQARDGIMGMMMHGQLDDGAFRKPSCPYPPFFDRILTPICLHMYK